MVAAKIYLDMFSTFIEPLQCCVFILIYKEYSILIKYATYFIYEQSILSHLIEVTQWLN